MDTILKVGIPVSSTKQLLTGHSHCPVRQMDNWTLTSKGRYSWFNSKSALNWTPFRLVNNWTLIWPGTGHQSGQELDTICQELDTKSVMQNVSDFRVKKNTLVGGPCLRGQVSGQQTGKDRYCGENWKWTSLKETSQILDSQRIRAIPNKWTPPPPFVYFQRNTRGGFTY